MSWSTRERSSSGTATSLHLDTLSALGRADEYGPREARVTWFMAWSTAGAALLGGVAGSSGLAIPEGTAEGNICSCSFGLRQFYKVKELYNT